MPKLNRESNERGHATNDKMVEHVAEYFANRIPKVCGWLFGLAHCGLSVFVYFGLLAHGMNPIPSPVAWHLSVGQYLFLFPFALFALPFPFVTLLAVIANSSFWGWVVYRVLRHTPNRTKA